LIVTKISFSQKGSNSSSKRKDTVSRLGARTVGVKERLKKEQVVSDVIDSLAGLRAENIDVRM
jgi:hypothetical protein